MVILSVIHVPIPQVDYHNIRHHDAPGQRCKLHDHLLRWHPFADVDDDVTLLHWHWFLPMVEPGSRHHLPHGDHDRPGSGPAFHVHIGDGLQSESWQGEAVLQPGSRGCLLERIALGLAALCPGNLSGQFVDPQPGQFSTENLSPADGLRAARAALLQRWNC